MNHNLTPSLPKQTTKTQFKALSAIKPEVNKPRNAKYRTLMHTTKGTCDKTTTEGIRNISER